MKSLLSALLLATSLSAPTLLLPINAFAQEGTLDAKAESSVVFTKGSDGVVAARTKNTRFVPYFTLDNKGADNISRLVTIVTNVELRNDREPVDPNAVVSVTVDDMGGDKAQRLASFEDPGEDGVIVADRYFVTTSPGCCAAPDSHHVRLLETGQHLFRSTGPGIAGITAWAEFPNARPNQVRWAAYAGGAVDESELNDGVLGTLTYGNDKGPLSTLFVTQSQKPATDEILDIDLASGAKLLWIDSQEKVPANNNLANAGPSSGAPGSPKSIWSLENVTDSAKVTGMVLVLELDGKTLISIPVDGDKLMMDQATINPALALKAASQ